MIAGPVVVEQSKSAAAPVGVVRIAKAPTEPEAAEAVRAAAVDYFVNDVAVVVVRVVPEAIGVVGVITVSAASEH